MEKQIKKLIKETEARLSKELIERGNAESVVRIADALCELVNLHRQITRKD